MNVAAATQAVRRRWWALQPRERLGLLVASGLLASYLLWVGVLAPAWQTLRGADAQRQQLQAQLQHMHTLAADAGRLRASGQPPAARWREELVQSLEALGEAQLSDAGDELRVQIQGCSPQELGRWLASLGPRWRLAVQQASLRADSQGLWQGQITLRAP